MSDGLIGPLEIEGLAYGGNGVARQDGRVVFVRGAVPGDQVRVRLLQVKKRFAEAEVAQFEQFSPQRCAPECPVFGDCGGCQWQMLPYAEQLRQKELIYRDILQRQCGVSPTLVLPVIESPSAWNYRSRLQLKCHLLRDGRPVLGFFRPASHFVVDVETCPIAAAEFNPLFPYLRELLRTFHDAAKIPQIDMDAGDDGSVRLVVHYLGADVQVLQERLERLGLPGSPALFLQQGRKSGLRRLSGLDQLVLTVDDPPVHLAYAAGGFAQINLAQNRRMVAEVMRMADLQAGQRVLDLYCGMGNFSLPAARRCENVVAVEEYAGSIAQGRENAKRNRIANVDFVAQPARGACTSLGAKKGFDLVLLDPPRSGAREVIAELVQQRIRRILYVSCDPMTLARDLKELLSNGYQLKETRPIDMFPQTYHLESLTLLELNG